HLEWNVKYEPGILIARGYKDGKEIITEQIETSGEPTSIILTPYQPSIKADGEDISVITVQVNDSKGNMVPTAGNEITFSIDGPGNIIGIGNGNPSSHEPDKYIEDVSLVKIESLKLLEVSDLNNRKEVDYDFNDSNWPDAFPKTRDDKWPPEETVRYIIIRGIFKLPEITENITVRLLAKSLGEEQEIYINGHLIEKSMKRDDPNQVYLLDNSILRKGKNVYAIAGTPLVKRYRWDNLNTDPGIIQVTIPAGTWKRCVFNGLAQVIVQSTKEFGTITLTATSPGLTTGILKLNVEPATPRPSVPTD
ncbi:MAG: hypothetical protein JXB17_08330, partial [Bacteroidales bacterium]|nr:hypothetical protein [Bacteroidales bacterium]